MYWSPTTKGFYSPAIHSEIPADAIEISAAEHLFLSSGQSDDVRIEVGANGRPELRAIEPPQPSVGDLTAKIDTAADAARRAVAGDPLRAVEYDRAAAEAQAFAMAGYQGEVPPMVAAWAIGDRTPRQAAESILAEAAQYNAALVQLRTVRLNAKELIRNAMTTGNVEQAQDIADETIASIEAAVAGIGNNAGV
ncbi:MAG: phage tail protein [Gammaproteobacteria bacterium]